MERTEHAPQAADRRVERTKHALVEALVLLLESKAFDNVSVAEITERANVGRSTFYAHFADKQGLLFHAIELLETSLANQASTAQNPVLGFLEGLVDHVAGSREVCASLLGRSSGDAIRYRMHELFCGGIRRGLSDRARRDPHAEHGVVFVAGAVQALVQHWVGQPEGSREELLAVMRRLVLRTLQELERLDTTPL
ncbi:MAG: TetR/AcrR family transcriptional regulator; helix-turn-helix transcriptional regulator [Nannocystaceae bacterium]|nr:TetR/AcrR family transcriptional regulator; helix-turn-helix transcriptional regulator [Nannocystaceae bacterium]